MNDDKITRLEGDKVAVSPEDMQGLAACQGSSMNTPLTDPLLRAMEDDGIIAASPQLPVAQMSGYRLIAPDDIRNIVEDLQRGIISANAVLTLKDWLSDSCVVASQPSNAVQDVPVNLHSAIDQACNVIREAGKNEYSTKELNEICDSVRSMFAAIVPQVVQAPIGIVRMHNKGGSGEFTSVEWVAGHAPQQDAALYAAPIVATVSSEQMEAEMWNRALEAAAMICDTSSLQPAIATRIRALKHATPSPTEQASDVRIYNDALTDARNAIRGIDDGEAPEYPLCIQTIGDLYKSATPADKGNAPVEVES